MNEPCCTLVAVAFTVYGLSSVLEPYVNNSEKEAKTYCDKYVVKMSYYHGAYVCTTVSFFVGASRDYKVLHATDLDKRRLLEQTYE